MNIAKAVSALFMTGVLSVPSFATSEALDQLKAQAESLGAVTPVSAQAPAATPVAWPAVQSPTNRADIAAAIPFQAPHLSVPQQIIEDIEGWTGHFVHNDLFPHLEPKGEHYLERDLNFFLVKFASQKECQRALPLVNLREIARGVYRSGVPTPEGFTQLKQMGVKTVVSLLQPYETAERPDEEKALAALGMSYVDIPIDWTIWPSFQAIDRTLAIMTDPSKQPVLIHCTCGNDRTGVFAAAYRVVVEDWTPEQAATEAKDFYWKFPAMGDLAEFLSSYARYRAGTVPPQPAPAVAAN